MRGCAWLCRWFPGSRVIPKRSKPLFLSAQNRTPPRRYHGIPQAVLLESVPPTEPPQLNWSVPMFRKRRTKNGKQATEARRAVSDLTLDKLILKEAARGNF